MVALLALGLGAGFAQAAYPDKPINMIIAFTAGGSSDVQARIMQKYWDKYSNVQWNFIYKPGAAGAIGFAEIASARKDGYTIGGANVPHMIIQPLAQKAQFTLNDFDYICQVVNDPQMVVVRKDSPHKSVKELFDYAQKNPGKLRVGLVGPNSGHHLMYLEVNDKYKFPVTHIFYKGAADQNVALLGGEIDAMFGNLNDVMRSREEMSILGIASEKRDTVFVPEVPTLKEQGYDIVSDIRRCFLAPKGIPPASLKYLRDTFEKIAKDPEYVKDMITAGQPEEYMTGDEFFQYMQTQNAKIEAILKKADIIK
jgi:tripartite-type tricarboxylate transporter receptor subunit TctC